MSRQIRLVATLFAWIGLSHSLVSTCQAGPIWDWLTHQQPAATGCANPYAARYPYTTGYPYVANYGTAVPTANGTYAYYPTTAANYAVPSAYQPAMVLRPNVVAIPVSNMPINGSAVVANFQAAAPTPYYAAQNACPACQRPLVVNYAPQLNYRTAWQQIPTTVYRPVVGIDPTTGQNVTVLQPCQTNSWQTRRVPTLLPQTAFMAQPGIAVAPAYGATCGVGCGATCGAAPNAYYNTQPPQAGIAQPHHNGGSVGPLQQGSVPADSQPSLLNPSGVGPQPSVGGTLNYPPTTNSYNIVPAVPNTTSSAPSSTSSYPSSSTTYPSSGTNYPPSTGNSSYQSSSAPSSNHTLSQKSDLNLKPVPDPDASKAKIDAIKKNDTSDIPQLLDPRDREASRPIRPNFVTRAKLSAERPLTSIPGPTANPPRSFKVLDDSGWVSVKE